MAQAAAQQGASREPARDDDRAGWKQEGKDLMRGLTGGAIVGMPLLYTMEVWWHGMTLSAGHLLLVLVLTVLVNVGFCFLSGFRPGNSLWNAVSDGVTAVGIGIAFSTLILWLIGELHFDSAPGETIGKIVLETVAVSIGVAFASAQIQGRSRQGGAQGADGDEAASPQDEHDPEADSPEAKQLRADLADMAATTAGATVFAMNIAPTEEVIMIASRLSPMQQLTLLVAGVLICYMILFASGFEDNQVHVPSVFQHPWAETTMCVAVSLLVALVLLAVLGTREAVASPATAVATTVTLGLPAIVGGAAGRLIV